MMKEITSVHNAAAQLLRELQKPRARREHGLFVCESAKMVGEAVALHLAQTLFVEKGREAEYTQMAAQAEQHGLRAVCRLSGGHAGSQHGENAAGDRLYGKNPRTTENADRKAHCGA